MGAPVGFRAVTDQDAPTEDFDDVDEATDEEEGQVSSAMWMFPVIAALVVVGFGIATYLVLRGPTSSAVGPEGVPIQDVPDLAPRDTTVDGETVNGIACAPSMGLDIEYHTHQLVTIYVDGEQLRIPAGVGITGPLWEQELEGGRFINNSAKGCVYWLHTHADDGVLHVESPEKRVFTLGDFFDIWDQPLSPTRLGPATGPVVAFVDGEEFEGDPRDIRLTDGLVLQLNVGEPVVPFEPKEFTVDNVCGDGTLSCSPLDQ